MAIQCGAWWCVCLYVHVCDVCMVYACANVMCVVCILVYVIPVRFMCVHGMCVCPLCVWGGVKGVCTVACGVCMHTVRGEERGRSEDMPP